MFRVVHLLRSREDHGPSNERKLTARTRVSFSSCFTNASSVDFCYDVSQIRVSETRSQVL